MFESRSRARRLVRVAAIPVVIMLAGATYQGVATALEQREFRRPGGLVSVGDHQLHLFCVGKGTPAVVLEAPAAGLSAAWSEVQHRVAARTRVCSYDRSGLGWSEAGDRPFDPGRVPEELRTLLETSGERGPYVIAGHGLGAAFARMYAARPDSEAAAVVLVNPPTDNAGTAPKAAWLMPASPWLARVGVLRAGRILSSKADALDGSSGAAVRAFLNRPDHLTRAAAEVAKWDDAVRMSAGTSLGADVTTRTVQVSDDDRIAFLSDPADIERVVEAIDDAVTTSRARPGAP